jgi:hypothetical protein
MATKINDKAGIRATFAARPDLKHVHLLEDGTHYFNKSHAEHMGRKKTEGEGDDAKEVLDEEIVTLARDSDELKEEVAKEEPAKPAK